MKTFSIVRLVVVLFLTASTLTAGSLLTPINLDQIKEVSSKVVAAAQEGDSEAVLLNGRRMLELVPNEPQMQAPVYLLMSEAAKNLGEKKRSEDYAEVAKLLDPALESRLKELQGKTVTRADFSTNFQMAANIIGPIVSQIEQIRLMKMCIEMVKNRLAPPPACSTGNALTGVPGGVLAPNPFGAPAVSSPFGAQPAQLQMSPVQSAPPVFNAVSPAPPVFNPVSPAPPVFNQPAPQVAAPASGQVVVVGQPQAQLQAQPALSGITIVFPAAAVGTQNYVVPAAVPAAMPGWAPVAISNPTPVVAAPAAIAVPTVAAAPAITPAPTQTNTSTPAAGTAKNTDKAAKKPKDRKEGEHGEKNSEKPSKPPYSNPRYKSTTATKKRGEEAPVFRVAHDHSRLNDVNYFETACGALLSVNGGNLTFTASGAEGALVIPAGEILEIRVNSLLGKEAGMFHIATKKGLYFSLAPESQDRDQARALIDTIKTTLGLVE